MADTGEAAPDDPAERDDKSASAPGGPGGLASGLQPGASEGSIGTGGGSTGGEPSGNRKSGGR